jgi:hypothetical protein
MDTIPSLPSQMDMTEAFLLSQQNRARKSIDHLLSIEEQDTLEAPVV